MGQITLYLDDEIEKRMAQAAKKVGLSKSKWVASLIKNKINHEWPASVIKLAGAWKEMPEVKLKRSLAQDAPREAL